MCVCVHECVCVCVCTRVRACSSPPGYNLRHGVLVKAMYSRRTKGENSAGEVDNFTIDNLSTGLLRRIDSKYQEFVHSFSFPSKDSVQGEKQT